MTMETQVESKFLKTYGIKNNRVTKRKLLGIMAKDSTCVTYCDHYLEILRLVVRDNKLGEAFYFYRKDGEKHFTYERHPFAGMQRSCGRTGSYNEWFVPLHNKEKAIETIKRKNTEYGK